MTELESIEHMAVTNRDGSVDFDDSDWPEDEPGFEAPDMSSYDMETINDGGGMAMVIGIPLVGLMAAGFIYLCWLVL